MPVLASLASFADKTEAITTRCALEEAIHATAELLDCSTYLIVVLDPAGAQRAWRAPDAAWLDAVIPDIARLVRRTAASAPRGFAWRELARLIRLTRADRLLLHHAYRHGVRAAISVTVRGIDGLAGSCTFATAHHRTFDAAEQLVLALVAPALCRAMRRIVAGSASPVPVLTPRQRECLVWAARGKTDWEIAQILSVGEDTIDRHLRHARERYGVDKRSTLIVHALFDGTVSFEEALGFD